MSPQATVAGNRKARAGVTWGCSGAQNFLVKDKDPLSFPPSSFCRPLYECRCPGALADPTALWKRTFMYEAWGRATVGQIL